MCAHVWRVQSLPAESNGAGRVWRQCGERSNHRANVCIRAVIIYSVGMHLQWLQTGPCRYQGGLISQRFVNEIKAPMSSPIWITATSWTDPYICAMGLSNVLPFRFAARLSQDYMQWAAIGVRLWLSMSPNLTSWRLFSHKSVARSLLPQHCH